MTNDFGISKLGIHTPYIAYIAHDRLSLLTIYILHTRALSFLIHCDPTQLTFWFNFLILCCKLLLQSTSLRAAIKVVYSKYWF